MNSSIEIAHLVNGELISVRHLSRRRELREIAVALLVVLGAFVAATALVAAVLMGAHRVVYGPGYLAVWLAAALGMSVLLGRRALRRARRYSVGVSIDDDAFAGVELDLVRRSPAGYQLGIAPGMTGTVTAGRSAVAVESLVGDGQDSVRLPLGEGVRADVSLGATTFVVRAGGDPQGWSLSGARPLIKRFARPTMTVVQLMAVASFLYAVPVGAAIGEAEMRSSIPAHSTPWETEKLLRYQAQLQARSLHRCFDVMPMECQRSGYVGIGLSLSRDGEIRSNWIARSTYGKECPVNQCMADVAAGWFFEPLPESMQVVLPVQVLRTEKPLVRTEAATVSSAAVDSRNGVVY